MAACLERAHPAQGRAGWAGAGAGAGSGAEITALVCTPTLLSTAAADSPSSAAGQEGRVGGNAAKGVCSTCSAPRGHGDPLPAAPRRGRSTRQEPRWDWTSHLYFGCWRTEAVREYSSLQAALLPSCAGVQLVGKGKEPKVAVKGQFSVLCKALAVRL